MHSTSRRLSSSRRSSISNSRSSKSPKSSIPPWEMNHRTKNNKPRRKMNSQTRKIKNLGNTPHLEQNHRTKNTIFPQNPTAARREANRQKVLKRLPKRPSRKISMIRRFIVSRKRNNPLKKNKSTTYSILP